MDFLFIYFNRFLLKKILFFLSFLFVVSCQKSNESSTNFIPKPKGYNRIDLPAHAYQPLTEKHPYTFQYSKYAKIKPDTYLGAEPHWIFIYYPKYDAMIEITYKKVFNDKKRLSDYINDAHKLAQKHTIKAYSIEERIIKTPSKKSAALIELQGEVPSYFQFYTTDSTNHYLRGALYFKTATQADSLSPIIEYLKKDIVHLLNTLEWKK